PRPAGEKAGSAGDLVAEEGDAAVGDDLVPFLGHGGLLDEPAGHLRAAPDLAVADLALVAGEGQLDAAALVGFALVLDRLLGPLGLSLLAQLLEQTLLHGGRVGDARRRRLDVAQPVVGGDDDLDDHPLGADGDQLVGDVLFVDAVGEVLPAG